MADIASIKTHAEVIGADGEYVGKVECVEVCRIKLVHQDNDIVTHSHRIRYVPLDFVYEVEGGMVRLSANSDVAVTFEEADGEPRTGDLPLPLRVDSPRKLTRTRGDNGHAIGEAGPWTRTTSATFSRASRPSPSDACSAGSASIGTG